MKVVVIVINIVFTVIFVTVIAVFIISCNTFSIVFFIQILVQTVRCSTSIFNIFFYFVLTYWFVFHHRRLYQRALRLLNHWWNSAGRIQRHPDNLRYRSRRITSFLDSNARWTDGFALVFVFFSFDFCIKSLCRWDAHLQRTEQTCDGNGANWLWSKTVFLSIHCPPSCMFKRKWLFSAESCRNLIKKLATIAIILRRIFSLNNVVLITEISYISQTVCIRCLFFEQPCIRYLNERDWWTSR